MSKQTKNIHEELEYVMTELINSQSFYANLLLNVVRIVSTDVPTMGVSVKDQVQLHINPYFFMSMNKDEAISVLIHEMLHCMNNHIGRMKELEPQVYDNSVKKSMIDRLKDMQTANLLNQAADFAINEFLPNLPKKMKCFDKDGNMMMEPEFIKDDKGQDTPNPKAGQPVEGEPCLVNSLQKKYPHKNIQNNMNMEYYYEILKEIQQENKQNGKGGTTYVLIDDHGMWMEGEEGAENVTEKIKGVVNKAIEASGGRKAGSIPSDLQRLIELLFYKPMNWKGHLRKFAARSCEVIIEESRSRRNRRYGIIFPGSKSFPRTKLGACVDTSGSMSSESLDQIVAELIEISKNNVDICLIESDAQVHNVTDFNPKKIRHLQGGGGTLYQVAIDRALEENVDGIIYFGDWDCGDVPVLKKKVPFLWVGVDIDTNRTPPGNFGSKIFAKIQKKK